MSEETDAIVVAVSEETGAISYAYKGQLTRGVTAENLRAFLTTVLVRVERPKSIVDWVRALGGRRETVPAAPASHQTPGVMRTGTDY